ncbi:putative integral membrane protein [Lasiodiplodia theobromae]|uniref:Uncharacterized protein n=1 Tax=Lasiodiplodia theobromae TaxID=45133 RepID=A0A5N5DK07_9PEZI|nr:hypothetical protein DBV05_g3706 [Lasiodiplodia theobromae]KAF9638920.1 putative integral membrane protein [Lasiodiplodia theobromae]
MAWEALANLSLQKPTPTPSSYDTALGFEQSVFGNHGHRIDDPSKVWIGVAVAYTFIMALGMTLLFFQRFAHTARIRGYWLTCSSVLALHVYLSLIFLAYPLRFWYKCSAEFWTMALIFPVGLGLYQISNSRIIFYYQTQQELLVMPKRNKKGRAPIWFMHPRAFLRYHKNMDFVTKTRVFVYATWASTIFACTFMYLGSINFHESYGLFGEWSGKANCHRGPHGEWVPTAISQLLICWVWGPYTLWYARNIRDSHYWSLQTFVNLIAGMPGTPLWMAFLYSNNPTVIAINRWFPHSGWFIPGIVTMQMGTFVFPILDFCRTPVYMADVEGEGEHTNLGSSPDLNRRFNKAMTSMAAFENALENNIQPLLVWAANRNFTAADINFLVYVRNWKNIWSGPSRHNQMMTQTQERHRYEDAAVIFFTFINPTTSKVTVNIGDATYRTISQYFTDVLAHDLPGEGTSSFFSIQQQVAPWEKDEPMSPILGTEGFDRTRLHYVGGDDDYDEYDAIPKGFNLSVFDDAYNVIKDDIFYNTWLRYVNDLDTSSDSGGASEHTCTEACTHGSMTPSPLSEPPQAHTSAARSPEI